MKGHKGKRRSYEETSKDKQEDLRGEVRRLRKQVQQLRRENAKLLGRDSELQDFFIEAESTKESTADDVCCPKCGSKEVKVLEKLRDDKDYFFCENPYCNARGPLT